MQAKTLFPGFRRGVVQAGTEPGPQVEIPYLTLGSGPPLLLLHGFPQNAAMWHKVAGELTRRHTLVVTDLRGYGDASKPAGDASPPHSLYSKRNMAADQLAVMRALGHERFMVAGHDRGGRVAHRLALDHPDAVERLMVLDIAPTLAMYERTDLTFAKVYWHWFFLIQAAPLPETLINKDPEFMLRKFIGGRHAGLAPFHPVAWEDYVRCARNPETIHAMCEDYRAAATVDLEHDRADLAAGRKLEIPVRVLWGEYGGLAKCYDPLALWAEYASHLSGKSLPCGHYLPEEQPEAVLEECLAFFGG